MPGALFAALLVVGLLSGVVDVVGVLVELLLVFVDGFVVLVVVLPEELPDPPELLVVLGAVDVEEVGPGSGSHGTELFGIVL